MREEISEFYLLIKQFRNIFENLKEDVLFLSDESLRLAVSAKARFSSPPSENRSNRGTPRPSTSKVGASSPAPASFPSPSPHPQPAKESNLSSGLGLSSFQNLSGSSPEPLKDSGAISSNSDPAKVFVLPRERRSTDLSIGVGELNEGGETVGEESSGGAPLSIGRNASNLPAETVPLREAAISGRSEVPVGTDLDRSEVPVGTEVSERGGESDDYSAGEGGSLEEMEPLGEPVYLEEEVWSGEVSALNPLSEKELAARHRQLEQLYGKWSTCSKCLRYDARCPVLRGVGAANSRVFVIVGPPNYEDCVRGSPLSDRYTLFFEKICRAVGLNFSELYFSSVIKCYLTPGIADVSQAMENCLPYLQGELDIVRPQIIFAMGPLAAQFILNTQQKLSKIRGMWHTAGHYLVRVSHSIPRLLSNPKLKREAWEDWLAVRRVLQSR